MVSLITMPSALRPSVSPEITPANSFAFASSALMFQKLARSPLRPASVLLISGAFFSSPMAFSAAPILPAYRCAASEERPKFTAALSANALISASEPLKAVEITLSTSARLLASVTPSPMKSLSICPPRRSASVVRLLSTPLNTVNPPESFSTVCLAAAAAALMSRVAVSVLPRSVAAFSLALPILAIALSLLASSFFMLARARIALSIFWAYSSCASVLPSYA